MTPGPGGVVGTAEAVSSVGVANLGGALRVGVPVTLTGNTILGGFVKTSAALVTV